MEPNSTEPAAATAKAEPASKKGGTRVFKKTSPNGKVTTYVGKRDFVDHMDHIDPIDGVVLIDPEYFSDNKKAFVHVLAAFRYGREDLDVLGLTFRKDLLMLECQVYPPEPDYKQRLTRLQERLLKKLGQHAYPFLFELPPGSPSSVTLQPAPGDTGKPCGVDYELKTYVAEKKLDKSHKSDTIRLAIRKITYAPEKPQPQPSQECKKEFMMSPHPMYLEASLDRGMYYHGQPIVVNVNLSNRSSRTCKRIKITVRQFADICLFSTAQYKCPVATIESEEGFPLQSGNLTKVYEITPLLDDNRDKRGLALDGKLKHEDTCLASSTIVDESVPPEKRENLGIIVHYRVKVRVTVALGSDIMVELPFMLTHPKPIEEPTPPPTPANPPVEQETQQAALANEEPPVDHNLIDFDTDGPPRKDGAEDDDLIFEDFARLRLKGNEHLDSAEA